MKSVALLRFYQATDSFAPAITTRADFERCRLSWGADAVLSPEGTELAGFVALPELLGEPVEWQPILRAEAEAGGPLEDACLTSLIAEIVARLSASDLDGVLVSLHGATAAVSEPDVCGLVLSRIREVIGPSVPLVATLSLQANVSDRLLQAADVLVGHHTLPPTDAAQTGRRAAQALSDLMKVGTTPQVAAWKIPMITPEAGFETATGALSYLWPHLTEAETLPGMLSVALFQPWAQLDAPEMGWLLYQACLCDVPPLDELAVRDACWAARESGTLPPLPYRHVSRPVYPLDDLEHPNLAPWAGDRIHVCNCSGACACPKKAAGGDEACDGCEGCGGCGEREG
jgi:microcystin degradation protein MlrC